MKRNRGFSIFRALGNEGFRVLGHNVGDGGKLKGSMLEQAYRELLLENQMLAESNQRLHERLKNPENGNDELPAARELIREQRNALAERSRRLRELEYEVKQYQREKKKLLVRTRQLAALVAQKDERIRESTRRHETDGLALAEAKMALREAKNELAKLTDKYYQLEAQFHRQSPGSVANGDF